MKCWRINDSKHRQLNFGVVAQLGERLNGIQEVRGSIPLGSTKLKSKIFILFLIFFLPLVICCKNKLTVELKDSDTLIINSNAYFHLCAGQLARAPGVSIKKGDIWDDLVTNAPMSYYLNKRGGPVEHAMPCDVVFCQKLNWPLKFTLYPFEYVREPNATLKDMNTPVIKKIDLKGNTIKVKIPYFTDKSCKEEKVLEKVFKTE